MKRAMAALILFGLTSCAVSSSFWQGVDKRLERRENEKEKLRRETDPVGHTKAQIRISEILLGLVGDAIKTGDYERMEQRLDEYTAAIRDAHQTMMKTGRDAHRKPKGFKDLEIALRRQLRQLEDIGGTLSFDQREHIDKAREDA